MSQHNENVKAFIDSLISDLCHLEIDNNGNGYAVLHDTKRQTYVATCIDDWRLAPRIEYMSYDDCFRCIKAWKANERYRILEVE